MMNRTWGILGVFVAMAVAFVPAAWAEEGEVTVAWSVWTGWMPFRVMDQKGFLAKRAQELGVKVKLVEFKGYLESVQAFSAGKVDACAMTSMESLQPAAAGIDAVAILVNDISNGGDGVLLRKGMTVADLKGATVLLEEFSVSHYLLARCLAMNGIDENSVTIQNTPGDEAGKAFLTDDNVKAVATWNPHLYLAVEGGKGEIVFDSTKIPGEIVDLVIANGKAIKANPKAFQALVLAWYDAMEMFTNEKTRAEAVAIMAEGAGASVEDFEKMLKGTIIYTDKANARTLLQGAEFAETMRKVSDFSVKHALITDASAAIRIDVQFIPEK